MNDEQSRLSVLSFLAASTDLNAEDCKPIKCPDPAIYPSPPVQRTVHQIGSDWASSSTEAVLDAFYISLPAEIPSGSSDYESLKFARASGSVEIDADMADIFSESASVFSAGSTRTSRNTNVSLVQCSLCHRPLLLTRAASHIASCRAAKTASPILQPRIQSSAVAVSTDDQQNLIYAPYKPATIDSSHSKEAHPEFNSLFSSPASHTNREKEMVQTTRKIKLNSNAREEDSWETALTPIAEHYVPRCTTSRRRRVLLPPPPESQRKRPSSTERKAISAANLAGLYPSSSPRQANGSISKPADPLREFARKMAHISPWAKLMQIALPLRTKRNPVKRKFPDAFRTISLESDDASCHAAASNGHVKNMKSNESIDRSPAPNHHSHPPSLIAALLWLRGYATRELSGTMMQLMDIPASALGRSHFVFHGQFRHSPLGSFGTDPRLLSQVKLPLGVVPDSKVTVPSSSPTAGPTVAVPVDNRQRILPQKAAPSQTNSVQPARKRARLSTQQPTAVLGNGNIYNAVTAQQAQAGVRKGSGRASALNPPNMATTRNPHVIPQHMIPHRHLVQAAANKAINGTVTSSAIAAAKYAKVPPGSQKGIYLTTGPQTVAGMHARVSAAQALQGTHFVSPMVTNPQQGTKSTGSRGSKGRISIPHHLRNPSPGMRVTSGIAMRNQSPSQGSSRSADRNSHMRNPVVGTTPLSTKQFEPTLLVSAGQQFTQGHNRHNMYASNASKQHLDNSRFFAQLASHALREDSSALARGIPTGMSGDVSQSLRHNMQGLSPMNRVKPSASMQSTPHISQIRDPPILKANVTSRIPVRKATDFTQIPQELEQQLRRSQNISFDHNAVAAKSEAPLNGSYGKNNNPALGMTNMSQETYSAALAAAAASRQLAPNHMLNNRNLALLQMAPNSLVGAGAPTNSNMLQGMGDMSHMAGLPMVVGMPGQPHGNSVVNFIQAAAASNPRLQNVSISNPMALDLSGNVLGQGANVLANNNALFQQVFRARRQGVNPVNPLNSVNPLNPGNPLNLGNHANPGNPMNPGNSMNPGNVLNPGNPVMNLNSPLVPQQMVDRNGQLNNMISGSRALDVAQNTQIRMLAQDDINRVPEE